MFQRGRAFPGHYSKSCEGQTGGGEKICGAAEETVRLSKFNLLHGVNNNGSCGCGFHVQTLEVLDLEFVQYLNLLTTRLD